MTEGQITFRLDQALKARIRELVDEGEYRNVSDFVNRAVLLMFAFERIPIEGRLLGRDPLAEFFSSYKGRQLLHETVREVLAE
ncbi:MAG: ribbon-helix-helix protein, CopG family [Methanospirillum sp.]